MEDPDRDWIEQETIEIFDPIGIEREVSVGTLLLTTIGAFGLMFVVVMILIFPLLGIGLISIYPTVYISPLAFLILSIGEIGFIVPPFYYIGKRFQTKETLGIKNFSSPTEVGLGLIIGIVMLVANLVVTYFIVTWLGLPVTGDEELFAGMNIVEVILWVLVMFVIVGFSEELLFRGFLQKRMEIHFKRDYKNYRIMALIATSLIFSLMHLDLVGLPTRFMLGMILGYLAQKRNYSIMGPTVAHGFNNAAVVVLAFLGF